MVARKMQLLQGILFLAAISICIYAMLSASAWSPDLGTLVFVIWAISPYGSFFAASRLLTRLIPSANLAIPSAVIAAIMLVFTVWAYVGTLGDTSSTHALIFIFVPLYLYVGGFFLLSIALGVSLFLRRTKQE
jgi:hypothetical protein